MKLNSRIASLIALLFVVPMAAQAITVNLTTANTDVLAGGQFAVNVLVRDIEAQDHLLAFGFDVSTDAGLSFEGATVAAPFFDDSALFPDTSVAGSAFPGVSGPDALIATLLFRAGSTPGSYALSLSTDPLDFGFIEGIFTELSIDDVAASLAITVLAVNVPVPAPSMMSLFIFALTLGFAGSIRPSARPPR